MKCGRKKAREEQRRRRRRGVKKRERDRGSEDESLRHSPLLALVKSRHLLIAIDMNDDIDVKLIRTTANKLKRKHHHLFSISNLAKSMTKR
jgi:hypothetical protein